MSIEVRASAADFAPSQSCSARNALVIVPGTAIFFFAISARENFCFATSIGPYPSPMLAPLGSSAYWSLTRA